MAPVPKTRPEGDYEDPPPTKKPRADDSKEEKPKPEPDTHPMALADQSPQPTIQLPLVNAEDEPADFVEVPRRRRCLICMEDGHSHMSCPLRVFCPPDRAVGKMAEIVCDCCCERIDAGVHANIPDMTRAQLIPIWPRCMPKVDSKALELEMKLEMEMKMELKLKLKLLTKQPRY